MSQLLLVTYFFFQNTLQRIYAISGFYFKNLVFVELQAAYGAYGSYGTGYAPPQAPAASVPSSGGYGAYPSTFPAQVCGTPFMYQPFVARLHTVSNCTVTPFMYQHFVACLQTVSNCIIFSVGIL